MSSTPAPVQQAAQASFAEFDFTQQLQNLMEALIANGEDQAPAEREKKEEPLLVMVPIFAAIAPIPAPAAFGLPSAGDQAGFEANLTAPALTAPVDAEILERMQIETQAPASNLAADADTELAFALRLTDVGPANHGCSRLSGGYSVPDTKPPAEVTAPVPQSQQIAAAPRVDAAASEPIHIGHEAPTSATAAGTPQQDSDSSMTHGDASDREPANETPQQRRTDRQISPATELEPSRHTGPLPAADNGAPAESASQTPGPAPIAMVSSPAPSRAPHSSSSVTATADPVRVADVTPALQPNPTSQVTEISVTVPVSRADSPIEERVAIRMVQRGADIHVSVRTPNPEVAQSLQQDLNRLSTALDDAGFRSETWRPAVTNVAGPSSTNTQRDLAQETPNRDTTNPDSRQDGSNGRGPGEQRRRHQDDRPRWVAELEQQRNR